MMGYSIEDAFKALTIYPLKFILEGIHVISAEKKLVKTTHLYKYC